MKKCIIMIMFAIAAVFFITTSAQAEATIVYPIDGEVYPKVNINPHGKVSSYYQTASFSFTCSGGPHSVKWGFDEKTLVETKYSFYDQMSMQFTWKLPPGTHKFWIDGGRKCGVDEVKFIIK